MSKINALNCWVCEKKISSLSKDERDNLWRNEIYFHCSQECHKKCKYTNCIPKGKSWDSDDIWDDEKTKEIPKNLKKKKKKKRKKNETTKLKRTKKTNKEDKQERLKKILSKSKKS